MSRSRHEKKACCSGNLARRVFVVILLGSIGLGVVNKAVRDDRPARPPAPRRLDRMSAESLADHIAETSATQAALEADMQVLAREPSQDVLIGKRQVAPPAPVAPRPGVLSVVDVPSPGPCPSPEKAKFAAAEVAAEALTRQLAQLDSPVYVTITAQDVLGRYLKKAEARPVPGDVREELEQSIGDQSDDWSTAKVSAEITPEQQRKLRAGARTLTGVKVSGALLACLGALLAYLALDSATKGYLSWALGVTLGGVALGTAAGLFYLI